MDLTTTYLGLKLPHPFIVGASPIGRTTDAARRAEDAGAAAIVMHSLFEEQFRQYEQGLEAHVYQYEETFAEATSYFTQEITYHYQPDDYLAHLGKLKEELAIPVVASLNGSHVGGWVEYAAALQEAGADALELNLYYQPNTSLESSLEVEERLLNIVSEVRSKVSLPLALKLSPFFTSLMHFAEQCGDRGADALVLFNRFYQPDIDLDNLETVPLLKLSSSSELLLRLRWLAMLHGRCDLDLSVTGGVHTHQDAIKSIMSGADSIQLVSCLLNSGVSTIRSLRDQMSAWMEQMEYESLEQMKGSMSYLNSPNPESIERANYLRILQSWQV